MHLQKRGTWPVRICFRRGGTYGLESYSISEIELAASFGADGKFMGFSVGGATSIKIKIRPED